HFTVVLLSEPRVEVRALLRHVQVGDHHLLEAEFLPPRSDIRCQGRHVWQCPGAGPVHSAHSTLAAPSSVSSFLQKQNRKRVLSGASWSNGESGIAARP